MKKRGSNMAVCTFAEARPGIESGLGVRLQGGAVVWPHSTCGNSHVLVMRQDLRLSLGVRLGQGPTVGQYFCDAAGLVPAGRGARSVENTQSVGSGLEPGHALRKLAAVEADEPPSWFGSGFSGFGWASCAGGNGCLSIGGSMC